MNIYSRSKTFAVVAGLCLVAVGLLAYLTYGPGVSQAATTKPNILLVMVDDLNDYVGVLGGHPQASTPYIDAFLSDEAVTNFTNAHTPSPACRSSRTAILSGLSPKTTGVTTNASSRLRSVAPDVVTLNQFLSDVGYETVRMGKINHKNEQAREWDVVVNDTQYKKEFKATANEAGYDLDFFIMPEQAERSDANFDWGPLDLPESEWADYRIVDDAIDYMQDYSSAKRNRDPFFLAVGVYKPHLPWHCPQPYFDQVASSSADVFAPYSDESDMADVGPIAQQWVDSEDRYTIEELMKDQGLAVRKSAVHAYLACSSFADAQVGRLLDGLEQAELDDDTIVVVMSDHGWFLGEKNTWKKFKLWEEATQVPFGIKVPSKFLGGNDANPETDLVVSTGSLYETLGHLVTRKRLGTDYRSLYNLLDETRVDRWGKAPVLSYYGSVNNISMRRQNFRYTIYEDGFEELYDHRFDPNENLNLAYDGYWDNLQTARNLRQQYNGTDAQLEAVSEGKLDQSRELLDKLD